MGAALAAAGSRVNTPRADGGGMDLSHLAERGVTGSREFVVERRHTTTVFGEQTDPPGLPAAADASADEHAHVLGSPHLLAACEFVGRESLHGLLPEGTGTVGERADLTHRRPAPEGARLRVETVVRAVDGPSVDLDATVSLVGGAAASEPNATDGEREPPGETVGEVAMTFRVVERERFRAALG
jgi:predicted thioesterase